MKVFKTIDKWICRSEEFVSAIMMFVMCIVVFISIMCRVVFKVPFASAEEIARYVMLWVIYIGIAVATRKQANVAVEVFVGMLPEKLKNIMLGFAQLIVIGTYIWLTVLATQWVVSCVQGPIQLTPLTRIPYWWLYTSLIFGFGLSTIHQIQIFVKIYILKIDIDAEDEMEVETWD